MNWGSNMKYLICVLCFVMLVGCGPIIDMSEPRKVSKITAYLITGDVYYTLETPTFFSDITIRIKDDGVGFANIGDTIMYEDGVIKVVKK